MSKYDFEINLSKNTSTGIILEQIQKGSVVLEFGCAAGRMTRYMKEALACRVYIVEYDQGAYETALQYAEDGLCDDIMTFRWAEKFADIRFDAIIFADVLEHLSAPERVLQKASQLLKDDGTIYVSIPNITHNDILLKAYAEHFDYTPTGLLDDTHIHFWGMQNIPQITEKTGLNIRKIEATYCPTGATEQYSGIDREENLLLENLLRERQCGEVYQFVITLCKNAVSQTERSFRRPRVASFIYLDTGNGFNADENIPVESVCSGPDGYQFRYTLDNTQNLRRIRLDPVAGQSCILRRISVRQGGREIPVSAPLGEMMEEGFLLMGADPMVCADVQPDGEPVSIDALFLLPGEGYLQYLEQDYCRAREDQRKDLAQAEIRCQALNNTITVLSDAEKVLRKMNADQAEEIEELRREKGAYIVLVNKKDMQTVQLEREVAHLEATISDMQKQIGYYQNLKVVRLYAFAVRIVKGIARRIKRLIGKR